MTINMTKGSNPVVVLTKSKGATITASVSWPAATDYDLGAEILYQDGSTESIATFPAKGTPTRIASKNGTVRHGGDSGRGAGTATEIITVDPDPDIKAVAFWAYSAQSNETISFRRYAVSMFVQSADETIAIMAQNASDHANIYTCVPGILRFRDGVPQVEYAELYSAPHSENRPAFVVTQSGLAKMFRSSKGEAEFRMDAGPKNDFK